MKKLIFLVCIVLSKQTNAQQSLSVTDSIPAIQDGLKAGYSITDESEKSVGKKGEFSRFKIKFYVTNTSRDARILMQKSGLLFKGSASPHIVEFNCSNATGARFTSKNAILMMQPCRIEATVEEKECGSDKTVQNRRLVDIGYWIKPGESIIANTIMILPLNEKPTMTVTFYPNFNGYTASTISNGENNPNPLSIFQGPVHIRNSSSDNYLNNEGGPLRCSTIDMQWWSAQWEIHPVEGTSYITLKNRWKNNYLSNDNASLLSANGLSANAMWLLEPTGNNNGYILKNAVDNTSLDLLNGTVLVLNIPGTSSSNEWIIEQ